MENLWINVALGILVFIGIVLAGGKYQAKKKI